MDAEAQKVFDLHDKVQELKQKRDLFGLSDHEEILLRNHEVRLWDAYSDWKDRNDPC